VTSIRTGDDVLLWSSDGPYRILRAEEGTVRVPGLGVLKLGDLLGREWGSRWKLADKEYVLLSPILADRVALIDRGAQIVTPKDSARIVFEAGLGAGAKVIEAGVGSGALTLALASAVAPDGKVFTCDIREDHLRHGKRNVEAAGLSAVVEFHVADATKSLPQDGVDATVFDLPEPELCVAPATKALRTGGVFVAYSPLVSQVEKTVQALRKAGYLGIRAFELLERPWVIGERGSRPETTMLGHTGFLVVARRA
jgi:tRNA (adenine57-N1/adenine58-N1)-methyltransferase catalytic subunit